MGYYMAFVKRVDSASGLSMQNVGQSKQSCRVRQLFEFPRKFYHLTAIHFTRTIIMRRKKKTSQLHMQ